MSFDFSKKSSMDGSVTVTHIGLVLTRTVFVPALCYAMIHHGIFINVQPGHLVIQARMSPEVWEMNLLVDSGPLIDDGLEICTRVYNLSNRRLRLGKGTTVSCLYSVKLQ